MKKFLSTILFIFMTIGLIGCQNNEDMKLESQIDANKNVTIKYLDKFPEVIDIVSYLGLKQEDANVLNDEDDRVVFCFNYEDEPQTVPSIKNYMQLLTGQGYAAEYGSATLFESDSFNNGKYEIRIVMISPTKDALKEW